MSQGHLVHGLDSGVHWDQLYSERAPAQQELLYGGREGAAGRSTKTCFALLIISLSRYIS